jgi:hypothetical protein
MNLKNFFRGYGSVLQLASQTRERKQINFSSQSDEEALKSDWLAIGDDLRKIIMEHNSSASDTK